MSSLDGLFFHIFDIVLAKKYSQFGFIFFRKMEVRENWSKGKHRSQSEI